MSELTWHLIEKFVWAGVVGVGLLLLTIARPWLGKQVLKLQRENAADFREFLNEINKDVYDRLDRASSDAEEALREMEKAKERIERVESASAEMGQTLAQFGSIPDTLDRVEYALRSCVTELSAVRVELARVDERGKRVPS